MATQDRTIDYLGEQLAGVDGLLIRRMFGEYGLSAGGKHVGVICNDQLYLKPTTAGRELAGNPPEEPPYRGAKPSLLIAADLWEDADWLAALVRATADALPAPKPKPAKKR